MPFGASRLQIPFLEFLRRRAERAELIDRRARGREGERLKRFGEHLVEIAVGDAGADVRIEIARPLDLRLERGHILDQGRVNGGIVVRGGERADGAGFHVERASRRR